MRRRRESKNFHLRQRLRPGPLPQRGRGKSVWIHAVSVGEVKAVRPLADALLDQGLALYFSTTTETGQELASQFYRDRATLLYFPLDWKFVCRRFLRQIQPDLVLLTETELWPNFIHSASSSNIPLALVNGRISEASFHRYLRFSNFVSTMLAHFDLFCMQSRADKQRIMELGAPENRTRWVGNLKYDYGVEESAEMERLKARIERLLKPRQDTLLWVCGSTREGEEEILLRTYGRLRSRWPHLKLLLAPRHPHRVMEVAAAVEASGLSWTRRSRLEGASESLDVLILDSIGELAHLYSLADLVYIGGSLVPQGGQNLMEPAVFGKPILFGPHMENFQEVADEFKKRYAALQVSGQEELQKRLEDLIRDPHARQWLGRNARKVIRDNQGALKRTLRLLSPLLQDHPDQRAEEASAREHTL